MYVELAELRASVAQVAPLAISSPVSLVSSHVPKRFGSLLAFCRPVAGDVVGVARCDEHNEMDEDHEEHKEDERGW